MINDKIREAKEKQLKKLDLSSQKLAQIPQEVFELKQIELLDLSDNKLKIIPESIDNLENLTKLDLSQNKLSSLPESIGNLKNLIKLNLSQNKLSSLPESIVNLTDLTKLDLSENPLINPPIEISAKGIGAIHKYLKQIKESGQDYIYEAKLIIVGEGGAGKTTLAKKINNPDYELQQDEAITQGIDVITWKFNMPEKNREFQVNIWDFSGQEIYHGTHRFFLTKRSLYTLVLDNRQEDDNLYYWLNIVELLSDNSPLLIVQNEKQNRKRELNELTLRGQFANLREILAANLSTNQGLEVILDKIKYYITNLDHIGTQLPTTWVKVRQALEEEERNYISLAEYLNICEANGITKDDEKLQLSGYLHDLGVCLHFQDEEDSILYKTVILKPEWATDAVYKVLDNKQVYNNQGHFSRNDLKNIWQDKKYSSMRGELLELMNKFEICYEIPGNKNTFITPQLLSEKQPEYKWDESNNLILRYTYPEFMPKGIISHFIVAMHQYIDPQYYVWKTGVILKQGNTKAEVIEDFDKREIRIRVVGDDKRGLLTIVSHELDKINNSYKRLKYQKLIPCNCQVCKNSQQPYTYEFNKLVERLAYGKNTIECGNPPYYAVQILSLIDDVINFTQLLDKIGDETYSLTIFDDIKEKKIDKQKDGTELTSINTGIIERQLKENYRLAIAEYEEKNKAALKSKDEEIAIYKEQVEELKKIIRSLSKEPIVIKQESDNNQ